MPPVVFVLLDGLAAATARPCMGYMQSLVDAGKARYTELNAELPPLSRPIYATLLSGKRPAESGIAHNDCPCPCPKPHIFSRVLAAGMVTAAAAYHWSWGYYVQVYHGKDDNGNTYSTLYAHMNSAPVVSVGQPVEKGKVLGYVGSTGNSTGNHLHLEMKVNNVLVNVMNYLS